MNRRLRSATALIAALSLTMAACSGGDDTSSTATTAAASSDSGATTGAGGTIDTIRTAFYNDMQVPDPDVFYEVEGNQVTMSTYEGLLRYKLGGTTEIEPLLAESYTVSPDAMTYTFKLRQGVTFVDGTPFDSAAAKFSFERRLKVNNAPAYMLADLDTLETPDASTLIVKLKKPVSAFLDYLACPYGPKMVSPALINANEKDGDAAQDWIRENSAGTGPYSISEFTLGQRYVLTANDKYWGTAPTVKTIDIAIVPDASTQVLQLEGGDLDIVHGPSVATLQDFASKDGFQVLRFPAFQKTQLKVNINKGPFADQALRTALRQAIDRDKLVPEVFGDMATVSKSMLPDGMLPAGAGADSYTYDPAPLKALVAALPGSKSIEIAYAQFNINDSRMAEAIGAVLNEAGFSATVKPIATAVMFDLRNTPDDAPDLLLETANPDASHPDTWARIFYNTEGFLNYLKASVPAADAEMDLGLASTTLDEANVHYAKAADLLFESAQYITLADVKAVYLARKGLGGLGSTAAAPLSLNMSAATDG